MNKFPLILLVLLMICVYRSWSESSSSTTRVSDLASSSENPPRNGTDLDDVPDNRIKKKKIKKNLARATNSDNTEDSSKLSKSSQKNKSEKKSSKSEKDRQGARRPNEPVGISDVFFTILKNIGFIGVNFMTGHYIEVFWNFIYIGQIILRFLHIM